MKKVIALIVLSLLLITLLNCKSKKSFEGIIEFEISYQLPPELENQRSFLPKAMSYYIGDGFTRLDQESGLGKQSTLYFTKTKRSVSLINLFGENIAVDQGNDTSTVIYKVDTEKTTKKIAGFKCKKAIVYIPGKSGQDAVPTNIYYTDEINAAYNSQFPGVKGFVLQYEINTQGMIITYTAKKSSAEVVDPVLGEIPSGYKLMSVKEFMDKMGG